MPSITTFLTFQEGAENAADFYVSIFPRSRVRRVTRYPPGAPGPEGGVMTVEFELDGQPFVALNGGPHFTFAEGVSLSVGCETQAEVDDYTDRLSSDGGQVGPCGWVTDRFGVSWQVNPGRVADMLADPDPARAARVMDALLEMKKIDLAALERVYAESSPA